MTEPDTLARMISEREHDIAELQAELDVLRSHAVTQQLEQRMRAELDGGKRGNGWRGPHRGPTRQQMLAKVVRDAGRAGLTRGEAIERMAALCDSPPASVAQMLSLLARAGQIKPGHDQRWRAIRSYIATTA